MGAEGSKGHVSKKEKKKDLNLIDYLRRLTELRAHLDVVGEFGKNS